MPPTPTQEWAPYTAIGQLLVQYKGEDGTRIVRGTAFRVASKHVLTAAHLLKAKDNEQFSKAYVVFLLRRETLTYKVKSFWLHPQYTTNNTTNIVYDIAVCSLKDVPDNKVPILGVIGREPGREDRRREVVGFLFGTGEGPEAGERVSSRVDIEPWTDQGGDHPFYYPLHSTEKGMSGGPVIGDEDGRPVIDGIISGDDDVKCHAAPLRTKTARLFVGIYLPALYV